MTNKTNDYDTSELVQSSFKASDRLKTENEKAKASFAEIEIKRAENDAICRNINSSIASFLKELTSQHSDFGFFAYKHETSHPVIRKFSITHLRRNDSIVITVNLQNGITDISIDYNRYKPATHKATSIVNFKDSHKQIFAEFMKTSNDLA